MSKELAKTYDPKQIEEKKSENKAEIETHLNKGT